MLTFLGLYLAVGVLFYLRLTASASGATPMTASLPRHGWHRVRRFQKSLLRRLRL